MRVAGTAEQFEAVSKECEQVGAGHCLGVCLVQLADLVALFAGVRRPRPGVVRRLDGRHYRHPAVRDDDFG